MTASSSILKLLLPILEIVKKAYSLSFFKKIIDSSGNKFKELFDGSFICIKSYNSKSFGTENSFFLTFVQKILYFPISLLSKFSKIYKQSLAYKIIDFFAEKTVYFIGISIFLFLSVPNDLWNNAYGLAAAVFILFMFLHLCINKNNTFSIKRIDISLLLFFLCLAFAVINPYGAKDGLRVFAIDLVPFIFIFVIVNLIKSSKDTDVLVYSLIAGISTASIYGIYQKIVGVPVDESLIDVTMSGQIGRVYSTMGNPNNFAEILVLFLPVFAYAIKRVKSLDGKFFITMLAVLPVLNLAFSYSRSSWIGFAASIFLFVFIINPKYVPALIVFAVLCVPILPKNITNRLLTISKDTSSQYRLTIWKSSFSLLRDVKSSWYAGIGLGPIPFAKCIDRYMMYPPAHSHMLLLEILIETGILGLLSFISLAIRMIFKTIFSDKKIKLLAVSVLSGVGAVFVVGAFEYVWYYPRVMWMFFISIGILMSIFQTDYKAE